MTIAIDQRDYAGPDALASLGSLAREGADIAFGNLCRSIVTALLSFLMAVAVVEGARVAPVLAVTGLSVGFYCLLRNASLDVTRWICIRRRLEARRETILRRIERGHRCLPQPGRSPTMGFQAINGRLYPPL